MPDAGSDAVVAGVAASDDNDMLVFRTDISLVPVIFFRKLPFILQKRIGGGFQKIHREMDSPGVVKFRHIQGSGIFGAAAKRNGVIFLQKLLHRVLRPCSFLVFRGLRADIGSCHKSDAFSLHQLLAAENNAFVQLHIRYAVHKQSADAVIPLKNSYQVSSFIQTIRNRQAGRATPDNRNLLPAAYSRNLRFHLSRGKSCLNDVQLIIMYRDGAVIHPAYTCLFAECGADPRGELRKTACFQQP